MLELKLTLKQRRLHELQVHLARGKINLVFKRKLKRKHFSDETKSSF